jgi:hypothetical protein
MTCMNCGFGQFCCNSGREGNPLYSPGTLERQDITLTAKIGLSFRGEKPSEGKTEVVIHNSAELEKFVHGLQELKGSEMCFKANVKVRKVRAV